MTTLVAHLDDIQHRLDALARQHHVLAVRKAMRRSISRPAATRSWR
jgi:hypothetical protein